MTGFNMPPGCSPSDIPGNSPADQTAEAFDEALSSKVMGAITLDEEKLDTFRQWVWQQMGKAYQEGYAAGQSDERAAHQITQEQWL